MAFNFHESVRDVPIAFLPIDETKAYLTIGNIRSNLTYLVELPAEELAVIEKLVDQIKQKELQCQNK